MKKNWQPGNFFIKAIGKSIITKLATLEKLATLRFIKNDATKCWSTISCVLNKWNYVQKYNKKLLKLCYRLFKQQ